MRDGGEGKAPRSCKVHSVFMRGGAYRSTRLPHSLLGVMVRWEELGIPVVALTSANSDRTTVVKMSASDICPNAGRE